MAAAATASVPLRELDDVTECPICAEVLIDARVLPCIHTFCLNCLQRYAKTTTPGAKRACPLCRQEFTVPEGGLARLPRNYFVEKVLEVKKLASRLSMENIECDLCSEDMYSGDGKKKGTASVFCTDCGRNMCDRCLRYHTKFEVTAAHRVIALTKDLKTEDLLRKFPDSRCEKHSEESIKLYCSECQLAVCMMCYVEEHHSHKCSDVRKVADELMKQLDGDISALRTKDAECTTLIQNLKRDEKEFADNNSNVEKAICAEATKLHELIDQCKDEMLEELAQVKQVQKKKVDGIRQKTELYSVIMRNFIKYGTQIKQTGAPCDIAKFVGSLQQKAKQFLEFDTNPEYNVKVRFTASSSYENVQKVFGDMNVEDIDFIKSARLLYPIGQASRPTGGLFGFAHPGNVTGIATHDNDLYVARWGRQHLEVYDSETFEHKTLMPVPGLGSNPRSLAACGFHKCLYVSEQNGNCVHKVSLARAKINAFVFGAQDGGVKWSVGAQPYGLSVNREHNVIVACYGAHKLQEFTTDGAVVREINLAQLYINQPVHAVQLPDGNYGVSHHKRVPGFSVIDKDGQIVKWCSSSGGGNMQIQRKGTSEPVKFTFGLPVGFAVDRRQRVIIADQNTNKILLLQENENPFEIELFRLAVADALNQPCCVHIDAGKKRLYVGEWGGGRVLCCGI